MIISCPKCGERNYVVYKEWWADEHVVYRYLKCMECKHEWTVHKREGLWGGWEI